MVQVLSRLSHPMYVPSIFSKECCRFSCDTLAISNSFAWKLLKIFTSSSKTHKCIQSSHNTLGSAFPFLLHQFPTFLVLSNEIWRLGAIAATGAASLCAAICRINCFLLFIICPLRRHWDRYLNTPVQQSCFPKLGTMTANSYIQVLNS